MKSQLQPWHLLLLILAGWINRKQQSVKEECLGRMIFFGERALQSAAICFLEHHHGEGNHQGIGNRLIAPGEEVGRATGEIACRERLGGLLRYYYREAA
jgi:putative transposase